MSLLITYTSFCKNNFIRIKISTIGTTKYNYLLFICNGIMWNKTIFYCSWISNFF